MQLLVLILLLVACQIPARGQAKVLGEVWSTVIPKRVVAATAADLDGDGLPELIVAYDDDLEVYTWNVEEHRFHKYQTLHGFPSNLSALAVATSADGRRSVWLGMDGSGPLQRLSFSDEGVVNHGTAARLWTRVARLETVDIDGDGGDDLLALGQDGTVVLFRSTGGQLTPVWRTEVPDPPQRFVAVGNYIDQGLPSIAIAKEQGPVTIYRWTSEGDRLLKVAENYPWGHVRLFDMVPSGSGQSDLFVATTQNLLYRYSWDGGTSRLVDQWEQDITNVADALQALPTPNRNDTIWVGLEKGLLTAWRLDDDGFHRLWQLPEPMRWLSLSRQGYLITFSESNRLRVIAWQPEDYLLIEMEGRGYRPEHPPLMEGDELYIAAKDLVAVLPIKAWSTKGGSRLSGVAGWFQFFIIDADAETAWINGRSRTLANPARRVDGQLYLPLSFLTMLGFDYEWFPPIRWLHLS